MKERIRQLTLSVKATVILLLTAATLIVVGIFNDTLKWDIFGPKIEAVLYGVFFSSIALAIIGVAMTIVLGIREVVHSFQSIERSSSGTKEDIPEASKKVYTRHLLWSLVALLGIIVMFAGANYMIQGHRSKVFKRIAAEQMKQFESRFTQIVSPLLAPPRNNVPPDLHDMIKSMDNLTYIDKTTLYLPDPTDNSALWGYTAWREYKKEDGFAKFFVAKDFEKAMAEALHGSDARMREINNRRDFIWYYLLKNQQGKPIAVLRIDGNSRENFREYVLGS
jgi:hypothetical protein